MRRHRIISTTITVAQQGQRINFEIKLPADTLRVTGVQFTFTGQTVTTPPTSPSGGRNAIRKLALVAGIMRLQVPGKADVFLAEQLVLNEFALSWMYASLIREPSLYFPGDLGNYWTESLGSLRPLTLALSAENTIIRGYYEDHYDGSAFAYGVYDITTYLYYEEDLAMEQEKAGGALTPAPEAEIRVAVELHE